MPKKPAQNPKLLEEIRSNYQWALKEWGPIHKEGNQDVKFIAGDPWDPRDIQARDTPEQKRPHLVFDEGSQYINMFCGQARQQKRAVNVEPVDERVDAETAKMMKGRIMHIEYVGRAQTHYIKALDDCATRSYGWISIRKKYSTATGREQEPCINPVGNPDSRLMDPNYSEQDGSDMEFCFVRDTVKKSYVKKKWKWAKKLGPDDIKTITLTEYWKVDKEVIDCTLWIEDPTNPEGTEIKESELMEKAPEAQVDKDEMTVTLHGATSKLLDYRDIEEKTIMKYTCQMLDPDKTEVQASAEDSVEILEEEEWDGEYIPEIPVLGKEYYINNGGTVNRVLLSMLRRARDPMQLLNYTRTTEAELVNMSPKTRFKVVEGQLEGHEDEWNNIGTSPLGFLQYKASVDPLTGTVLGAPEEIRWEPPLQATELLASSCQNAIRSAIGQLASPELDKTKSGVALQKIREGGESAVYHILDNWEKALEQVGRVYGDLIERTHDSVRTAPIRDAVGNQKLVTFNKPYDDKETKKRVHYPIVKGAFSYTMTTGPSYQSQYEESSDFVDTLINKAPELFVTSNGQTILGDLAVKLKNLGPIGDLIVARFEKMLPPQLQDTGLDIPPAVQQELQKGQQVIDGLTEKVNQLTDIIRNKQLEIQSEERRNEADNKTKLAIAEINAQVKENIAQLTTSMDQIALRMTQQWEAMQGAQQAEQEAAQPAQSAAEQQQGQPAITHTFNPETQELQPANA